MKFSNLIRESEAVRILGGPRQMHKAKAHGIIPMFGGLYSKSLIQTIRPLVNPAFCLVSATATLPGRKHRATGFLRILRPPSPSR